MNRYEVYKHACLIALALAHCMLMVLYSPWITENPFKTLIGWMIVYSFVVPCWRYTTKECFLSGMFYLAYYFSFLTLFTKVFH